jgi:hypothetical protein
MASLERSARGAAPFPPPSAWKRCYGRKMKDQRLKTFRSALESLVESLEAVVRVARWSDREDPPEPLSTAVSKLAERLAIADRLVSGTFVGTATDTSTVSAMCETMRQLDMAYVVYRKRIDTAPDQMSVALATLEADMAEAIGPN